MEKKTADKKAKEPVSSEKLKALNNAMAKIEKDFGRGTIMKLGDDNIEDIEVGIQDYSDDEGVRSRVNIDILYKE